MLYLIWDSPHRQRRSSPLNPARQAGFSQLKPLALSTSGQKSSQICNGSNGVIKPNTGSLCIKICRVPRVKHNDLLLFRLCGGLGSLHVLSGSYARGKRSHGDAADQRDNERYLVFEDLYVCHFPCPFIPFCTRYETSCWDMTQYIISYPRKMFNIILRQARDICSC